MLTSTMVARILVKLAIAVLFLSSLLFFFVPLYQHKVLSDHSEEIFKSMTSNPDEHLIHIVVVACGDRLEEALINIKSSLLFTKHNIFYHIFAEDALHSGFVEGIWSLPVKYRSSLQYKLYKITYPKDENAKEWKELCKLCASQRLFLPTVLSEDIDSVIFVDTDVIFLSDVFQLWSVFAEFNSTQLSAMCIEYEDEKMGWYNRLGRTPYYGKTGLNAGIILMNLTRMRKAKFRNDFKHSLMTWKDMLQPLYDKYQYSLTWGEQDLLNIIFHYNSDMLYELSCDWNYRPDHCMFGQMCKPAKNGVKVVHGFRGVYHNEKEPAFKAVFDAIKAHDFQDMEENLIQVMARNLKMTETTNCGKEHNCFLKGLRKALEDK
ncbi:glucoside xylosyltransferase 1-like [Styela clava]